MIDLNYEVIHARVLKVRFSSQAQDHLGYRRHNGHDQVTTAAEQVGKGSWSLALDASFVSRFLV